MTIRRPVHVLSLSPPHLNGYAVRTHSMLCAQRDAGLHPVGITSPYYPLACMNVRAPHTADGITYHRVPNPRLPDPGPNPADADANLSVGETFADRRARWIPRFFFQIHTAVRSIPLARRTYMPRILDLARAHDADIIHAHTPFRNGFPSLWAARRMGIPFVYEMRGLWEDTAVEAGKFKEGTPVYRGFRWMETRILRRADAVITITQALAEDIVRRGVPRERIFVVPNGAPRDLAARLTSPEAAPVADDLRRRLGITPDTPVIGYVGSIRRLEGIQFLADNFGAILRRVPGARLLIVGGGDAPTLDAIRRSLEAQGVADRALVPGPLPNAVIAAAYSVIDVLAITRLPSRVTRIVSPLKPFEAMALGKAVLLPDLPAMAEILDAGRTGWQFRAGDAADFVEQAATLLGDAALRARLGAAAAESVAREKTWAHSIAQTQRAYEHALAHPRGRLRAQ